MVVFRLAQSPSPGDSRQISKYDSWESHFNRGFLGYGAHYQLPVSTNKALAHNMEKTMKSHGNLQRVQMQCGHFSCFRNQANQLRDTCWELTFFCTGMRLPRPYGFQTGEPRKQRHPDFSGCFNPIFWQTHWIYQWENTTVFTNSPLKYIMILVVIGIQGEG